MINKITEYRTKKNMTQDALAEKANITRPYLSDLENNKKKPSFEVADRIAKALGEPVDAIFFGESVNHSEQITA